MKVYQYATVKRDGKIIRRRVFRNVDILIRYYKDMFDFGHFSTEDDGYPALSNDNTFLSYEDIILIEAMDC